MTTPSPLRPPLAQPGAIGISTSGNPIVDEIDQAHAALSPQAKQAIEGAHGMLGLSPQSTAAGVEKAAPALAPAPSLTPAAAAPLLAPSMGSPATAPGTGLMPDADSLAVPQGKPQMPEQSELSRLRSTGSGISQIHNPLLRGGATVLDALGQFFPRISQAIPGTTAHHQMLEGEAQRGATEEASEQKTADDLKNTETKRRLEEAQTKNQEAIPEMKRTAAELAASKVAETSTHNRAAEDIARERETGRVNTEQAKHAAKLAATGFKEDERGKIVPLPYEEMSETQQSVHDLKAAQEEREEATAALKKAQASNQPAVAALAQRRLDSAGQAHSIALRRLGLSEKQFEMRAHGTEGGIPLPGSISTDTGQPVGTAFQGNVKPTGTQRDAAGRADTMLDLDARIRSALKNPEIQKGTGPLMGRLSEIQNRLGTLPHDLSELKNDLVSYGAFQAGLHPVRGIGALQYFDKVMGGLGQKPEELLGKLDSNKATATSVKKTGDVRTAGSSHAPSTGEVKDGGEYTRDANGKLVLKK